MCLRANIDYSERHPETIDARLEIIAMWATKARAKALVLAIKPHFSRARKLGLLRRAWLVESGERDDCSMFLTEDEEAELHAYRSEYWSTI